MTVNQWFGNGELEQETVTPGEGANRRKGIWRATMLRNYWYIACAATQLSPTPRATQVLDQELVLFAIAPHPPRAS